MNTKTRRVSGIVEKLRSERGDSLTEALVAILIGSLSLVMLAGAIGSASSMVHKSNDKMAEYYAGNTNIVRKGSTSGSGTVSFSVPVGSTSSVPVNYYISDFRINDILIVRYERQGE